MFELVTQQDVKIERAVEAEELKELRELREALQLIGGVLKTTYGGGGYQIFSDRVSVLDKVARILLDAKIRNDNIVKFSARIDRDLLSFRGGGAKEKYLTTEERRVITTSRNVAQHLKSIFQEVEQTIHFAKQATHSVGYTAPTAVTAGNALKHAADELQMVISAVQQLYALERQLDVALGR